jgi:hypothetical protein
MRSYVDGIMRARIGIAQRYARWLFMVLVLQMAGSVGLAQENIGQIPTGEERSNDYTVRVGGEDIPVYSVKVAPADRAPMEGDG